MPGAITQWEGTMLIHFQNFFHNAAADRLFTSYTAWGNIGQIWILLGLALLFFKKTRRSGIIMLASVLLTRILNNLIIKQLVMRPRPYDTFEKIRFLVEPLHDTSFPSGHTATAFGSAMVLFFRKDGLLRWLPFAAAVLMGFSRLYVGAHYFTDVRAGALVGTLVAAFCVRLFRRRRLPA